MTRIGYQLAKWATVLGTVVGLSGCQPDDSPQQGDTIQIGMILSLTGPGSSWGQVSLQSAQAVVSYYNDQGGFEIDGVRYPIELIVEDDQLDPNSAVDAVQRLVFDQSIQFVIGPLGDDSVVAVAPILDVAKVVYLHYGFDPALMRENSTGILGSPIPKQTLPLLYGYLQEAKSVKTVCVIAYDTREAVQQKIIAEYAAREAGLEVLGFSQFDILEETLNFDRIPEGLTTPILEVVELQPDAVLLTGVPPQLMTQAVEAFRSAGYSKPLVAQNSQDVNLLMQIGQAAEGVIFVGGDIAQVQRSVYYQNLKQRYLDIGGQWTAEVSLKLYAMESMLQFIRHIGGPVELKRVDLMVKMNDFEFQDPFFADHRMMHLVGETTFGVKRQLSTPVVISEMIDGVSQTVAVAELPE